MTMGILSSLMAMSLAIERQSILHRHWRRSCLSLSALFLRLLHLFSVVAFMGFFVCIPGLHCASLRVTLFFSASLKCCFLRSLSLLSSHSPKRCRTFTGIFFSAFYISIHQYHHPPSPLSRTNTSFTATTNFLIVLTYSLPFYLHSIIYRLFF